MIVTKNNFVGRHLSNSKCGLLFKVQGSLFDRINSIKKTQKKQNDFNK